MKDRPYYRQAELMLRSIPLVAAERSFALKGGTAINLFVRDMPRLSVDIDLTYLPVDEARDTALRNMSAALDRIARAIKKGIPGTRVQETHAKNPERVTRLTVAVGSIRIKIEPNEVIRGSVYPTEERDLVRPAEKLFELSVTAKTLSLADLYGGKLCAALDRQHPRDLFDVKLLLDNEGVTEEIRKAFVVYLASHDRPMHELLHPNPKNLRRIFENEFAGMTIDEVTYDELIAARETLVRTLTKTLTAREIEFLLSLKAGQPKWDLIEIEGIEKLPAVQWKLLNIRKLDPKRQKYLQDKLRLVLGV